MYRYVDMVYWFHSKSKIYCVHVKGKGNYGLLLGEKRVRVKMFLYR